VCALQGQIDRFTAQYDTGRPHPVSDRGTRIWAHTRRIKVALAGQFNIAVAVAGQFHAVVGRIGVGVPEPFHAAAGPVADSINVRAGSSPQSQQHRTLRTDRWPLKSAVQDRERAKPELTIS
jgi:hypothetical protein